MASGAAARLAHVWLACTAGHSQSAMDMSLSALAQPGVLRTAVGEEWLQGPATTPLVLRQAPVQAASWSPACHPSPGFSLAPPIVVVVLVLPETAPAECTAPRDSELPIWNGQVIGLVQCT